MNPQTKSLVYQAESNYLSSEELQHLEGAVKSMPKRLSLYRFLRDRELPIMQSVADLVEQAHPKTDTKILESAIKHLLLVMRYGAMAVLTDNPQLLQNRLLNWASQTNAVPELQEIMPELYQTFNQVLTKELSPEEMALLLGYLDQVG